VFLVLKGLKPSQIDMALFEFHCINITVILKVTLEHTSYVIIYFCMYLYSVWFIQCHLAAYVYLKLKLYILILGVMNTQEIMCYDNLCTCFVGANCLELSCT
jgi:hypothetical protein